MSNLTVYYDHNPKQAIQNTDDAEVITHTLKQIGIHFERFFAEYPIHEGMDNEQILIAYQQDINRLKEEEGYQTVDVVSMYPDHPQKDVFREKFLDEHTHSEDEVRFFVAGEGLFCLHIQDKIYQVLCCKNDLISVPADTAHWFDMGSQPQFTAIRFFNNTEGWIAHPTGSPIAREFPLLP